MSKSVVTTTSAPAAIGPYSQAIRSGSLIFTAGQAALDPQTGQLVSGGIAEQTTRTLENLKAVLEAAGSSLAKTVKATVYLKNMGDFAAMNAVYATYLAPDGVTPPARTTIEASRLPKDALVEIELIAEV
jgi:2-iminobutanoate/2-iminopropanoate deaminase